jgi:hypothetical protein
MLDSREQHIIDIIENRGECSSKEVFDSLHMSMSYATLKRA